MVKSTRSLSSSYPHVQLNFFWCLRNKYDWGLSIYGEYLKVWNLKHGHLIISVSKRNEIEDWYFETFI